MATYESLKDLFEAENGNSLFDDLQTVNYKGWTISENGYGYTVRNAKGYLSLETSKYGTIEDCKEYIDSALSFKAVN